MIIALNETVTMHCNLVTDIRIARETGYGGIEVMSSKLFRYLDSGMSLGSLLPLFEEVQPVGIGYVQDIDRWEPSEYDSLLRECEKTCALAERLAIPMVQLLTGPRYTPERAGPEYTYQGPVGMSWPEIRDLTARNLRTLADIGASHKVRFYLEPLAWASLCTLEQELEVIDAAEQDNLGMLIDFWHLWATGSTPDDVARLDKSMILGVHFCDGVPKAPGDYWCLKQRDVWTGSGCIPLKEWVDAVLSTGYDGWWAPELLSPRYWEQDPSQVAADLKETLISYLAAGGSVLDGGNPRPTMRQPIKEKRSV